MECFLLTIKASRNLFTNRVLLFETNLIIFYQFQTKAQLRLCRQKKRLVHENFMKIPLPYVFMKFIAVIIGVRTLLWILMKTSGS